MIMPLRSLYDDTIPHQLCNSMTLLASYYDYDETDVFDSFVYTELIADATKMSGMFIFCTAVLLTVINHMFDVFF